MWLEGAGYDSPEDFELLWYFAAKHTAIDAFDKHGKKGFLFTIGDADTHKTVRADHIKAIFDDKCSADLSSEELAKEAGRRYELFHIFLCGSGKYEPQNLVDAIPGRIIYLNKENVGAIPEVIISTMQLVNGMAMKDILAQWSDLVQPVVKQALSKIKIATDKKRISF